MQLTLIEVKSQWLKRLALQRFLPVEIRHEVKELLILGKTEAGTDIYKKIKLELLSTFGAKPEDAYTRAKNRVMTGLPSQLGKALLNDICKKSNKLDGCCCSNVVWGMYRENLPVVVRNHIAELTFNKDTYKEIFKKSDQVFASNSSTHPGRGAAVAAENPPLQDSEVAAIRPLKKNKNQKPSKGASGGNCGGGKAATEAAKGSNTSTNTSNAGRTRHPTAIGDSEKLCKIHFKWGENGSYCAVPWKCPMKNIYKAPQ